MRFFSPRSALVLSASGSLSRNSETPDGGVEATSTSRSLFLALGVRRHNIVASRVLATTELGADLYLSGLKATTDAPVLLKPRVTGEVTNCFTGKGHTRDY